MTGLIILGVILFIVLVVVLSSIKIVNTGYLYVVERFGQSLYSDSIFACYHAFIAY